jgi:hypothetical protein
VVAADAAGAGAGDAATGSPSGSELRGLSPKQNEIAWLARRENDPVQSAFVGGAPWQKTNRQSASGNESGSYAKRQSVNVSAGNADALGKSPHPTGLRSDPRFPSLLRRMRFPE